MTAPPAGSRRWLPLALALSAPVVPLVVALVARRHPVWVPDLDLALTELRVRDVGSRHSPLVGLPGRFGTLQQQGSHPGPISFYLLAPLYRGFGGTSFALQGATVALHGVAALVTVGMVGRRAGRWWAVAASAALVAFIAAIGPALFTEPWNPYLPLLWWPAFLAAVWCAWRGEAVALPVVVVAGAICGQTHVPYLGPVGLLSVLALVGWLRRRPVARPALHLVGAGLLALALWAPPIIDQARHDPGNVSLLADHLLSPSEPELGVRDGARLVLEHLDLPHLARTALADPGRLGDRYPAGATASRGALTLLALAVAAFSGRRRSSDAARAALVVALVGIASAGAAASRIVGHPWGYLTLWVWPVALAAALAVAATVSARWPAASRPRWRASAAAVGALTLVGLTAVASGAASEAEPTNPIVSRTVLTLVPEVVAALEPEGRYLLTWTDSIHLGAHGYGLFDELERRGVDVGVPASYAVQFGRHRVLDHRSATGQIVVATGPAIARWDEQPGRRIAAVDVRTPAERAEAARARSELVALLRRADLQRLVPLVDDNLFAVAFDPDLPDAARPLLDRLDVLGAPAAVFLVPAGAPLP